MADPSAYQRNLRDLVNTNASVKATPGANLGEVATDYFGRKAMQDARARGEETQSAMKGEVLAATKEKAENAMATQERIHEANLEAKEETHLADLAFSRAKQESETQLRDEELAAGERQSERALLFTGLGTAIKLGNVALMKEETRKIMDKQLGYSGAYEELGKFYKQANEKLMNAITERINTFRGAP